MEWRDTGIVLAAHRFGEHDVRLEVLTAEHGRASGLVKGGLSRRLRAVIQPGNRVSVLWRARIESQLGNFTLEPLVSHSLALSRDAGPLLVLTATAALASVLLPEREPHRPVHDGLAALVTLLDASSDTDSDRLRWATGLVRWELGLLRDLGFGLDLEVCAATGQAHDLVYVSPRTGRAVSREPGLPYAGRLLSLPAFLTAPGSVAADFDEVFQGLSLTAFFLGRCLLEPKARDLPGPRQRLAEYIAEQAAKALG